ncbi:hypothetical protein DIE23_21595 [Burkholderia sp. Bp9143]|uniref:hypothetical protein n=1 Tax=Burkholderia sp. Bp9143 TaxID=2184574 RepID=UPI000F5AB313|nr:hypothetical protein [Burkholderia sp. Bp9143]RQR29503.1 hypothetical protein DIE23_21595 [Burkholderia sp. Bp9143]
MDKKQIADRLKELKDSYEAGEVRMRRLDAQREELRQTLLRIGGAIQVMEELLKEKEPEIRQAPDAEI